MLASIILRSSSQDKCSAAAQSSAAQAAITKQAAMEITAASFTNEAFANLQPRRPRVAKDPSLPVLAARDEVLAAVRGHSTVLVVGETGSGKSDASAAVPPRRQTVRAAGRPAPLRHAAPASGGPHGERARRRGARRGHWRRGRLRHALRAQGVQKNVGGLRDRTALVVREMLGDEQLQRYGVLIVDEAHERSVHTDVLLGLAKRTQSKRPLKLILMSATLDIDSLKITSTTAPSSRCRGASTPSTCSTLSTHWTTTTRPARRAARSSTRTKLARATSSSSCRARRRSRAAWPCSRSGSLNVVVVPLYAALSKEKQLEAFAPAPNGKRKFIVSTTIAETSVTVQGVRHVVDPGWAKNRGCDARGFEALRVEATSKAQARQRAGRAGREAPGRCYRLYPEAAWDSLPDATAPEILRCDLAGVVLSLKALGVARPETFDFVTKPPRHALLRALETLYACEALDDRGALTALGRRLASLPLPPLLASAVDLASTQFRDGAPDVLWVVAAVVSSEHGLFVQPRGGEARDNAIRARDAFEDRSGDLWTSRNALKAAANERNRQQWCRKRFLSASAVESALRVRKQLLDVLSKDVFAPTEAIPLDTARTAALDCVAKALCVQNAAVRDPAKRCFRALRNDAAVAVHPGSILHGRNPPPEALVFASSVQTTKLFLRGVSAVDASTLARLAPRLFSAVCEV